MSAVTTRRSSVQPTTMRTQAALALALVGILAVVTGVPSAQTGGVITDPEVYTVYRAAFALPGFANFRNSTEGIAVLDETRFDECTINADTPAEWLQLVPDFRAQNVTTRTYVARMLDLGVPVQLVPLTTVTTLLKSVGFGAPGVVRGGWGEAYEGFPQRTVLTFSAVGFNADKSAALITVSRDCGLSGEGRSIASGDCDRFNTFVMQKDQGRWTPARGGPLGRQCLGGA